MNFLTVFWFLTFYVFINPSIDCFFIPNPINWFRKSATELPKNMTVPALSLLDSKFGDQVPTKTYEELFQMHINQSQPSVSLASTQQNSLADRLNKTLKPIIREIVAKTTTQMVKKLEVKTTENIDSYKLKSGNLNQTLTSEKTTQSDSSIDALIEDNKYNKLELETVTTEEVSPTPVYRQTSPATDEILVTNSSEDITTKPILLYREESQSYPNNMYNRYENKFKQKLKTPFGESHSYNRWQRRQPPEEYKQIDPYQTYHPSYNYNPDQSSEDDEEYELVKTGSWLFPGIIGLIISILPVMIVVASLIPAVVSVPVISTTAFGRRFKRSEFEISNKQIFLNSLEDTKCLTKMFCTFVAQGKTSDKNLIQNIIYQIIDWTSKQWAKWLALNKLFNAIKLNKCETIYKCMSRKVKFKGHRQLS